MLGFAAHAPTALPRRTDSLQGEIPAVDSDVDIREDPLSRKARQEAEHAQRVLDVNGSDSEVRDTLSKMIMRVEEMVSIF